MGVTYKLTDEIIGYIITQRKANALLSCRALAEAVEAQFAVHVSKSSIHEVLKQANIASTRGRKPKDSFAIPVQKKQVIKADLSKALLPLLDDPGLLPEPTMEPAAALEPELPVEVLEAPVRAHGGGPWVKEELPGKAGAIFLKAVFWDLCPQRVWGIKGFDEIDRVAVADFAASWGYLTKLMTAIKVSLEDGCVYYLDARLRGVHADNPNDLHLAAPIEKVMGVVVERILSNKKPLVLGGINPDDRSTADFLGSFSLKAGKKIQKIEIVDEKDHNYAEFSSIVGFKRNFIIKESIQVDNECGIVQVQGACLAGGLRDCLRERMLALLAGGVRDNWQVVEGLWGVQEMNNDSRVVTIYLPDVYDNKQVLERAVLVVNGWGVEDDEGRILQLKLESEKIS